MSRKIQQSHCLTTETTKTVLLFTLPDAVVVLCVVIAVRARVIIRVRAVVIHLRTIAFFEESQPLPCFYVYLNVYKVLIG